MATTPADGGRREFCERCDRETPHAVRIELRTESSRSRNAAFSREPYRVSECRNCGHRTDLRMNNA